MNILSRFAVFCLAVLPAVLDAENKPELVFHLPFDGDAVATVGGQPKPLVERNLQFVPGVSRASGRADVRCWPCADGRRPFAPCDF